MQPLRDPDVLAGYLSDASNLHGHAEALVRPRTTAEVAEVVRHCQAHAIPLTVTAGRTSTTGGAVPEGGWLLSTELMTEVLELTPTHAVAQAGILLGALQDQLEAAGRLYPPDPTSRHECSLGGSIVCNASGARTFRYGPSRDWVEEVEAVLANGEVVVATRDTPIPSDWPPIRWTEPRVKTAAGYFPCDNLLDLLIGQEGTLGIVTRAKLRLTDLPESVFSLVGFFPSRDAGLAFVRAARTDASVSPRLIEWYDRHTLGLVRAREPGVPADALAAVWVEQEATEATEDALMAGWLDLLEGTGALVDDTLFAADPGGLERLYRLRHAVPAGVNELVIANGMPKVGTDCSVPDDALEQMMDAYDAVDLPTILFGHIGDNHLHLNMLPATPDELAHAKALYADLCRLAVRLGGSVSAEHGIGKLKRAHLAEMVGPEVISAFRALKAHLDPSWILGRGNLLDPPGL